ncbi:MAG TPA: histidinol-phosphate transaminase [Bacteroidales bacterium]|nr:histidinol-phosphate transaminase [Bacteroidales bacterium]
MRDLKALVRQNVLNLTPYSCARDEFQGSEGIFLDANENPYGTLNRYPDPYQKELKKKISEIKAMPEENIFIGNGSDEVIDLCYRTFCNPGLDNALIFPPTYGMYEVSAAVNDIAVVKIPLNTEFQIDAEAAQKVLNDKNLKLIFICSPNNPTGNAMNKNVVDEIIQNFSGIVVIDEAYSDFSDKQSFAGLVDKYNNIIVMQTFSKALGLAAARVGMALTSPEIVSFFNKIKPPYNVSTINQKAALARLGQREETMQLVKEIVSERERMREEIGKFPYVEKIFPSDANFLLIKVNNANDLYQYLISGNIVVRNRNSIIGNCIRITVGKKSENELLIKSLEKYPLRPL